MSDTSTTSELNAEQLSAIAESWAPESRAAMVEYLRSAHKREEIKSRFKDVTQLAQAIDPNFVITPALQLIGSKIEIALTKRRRNLLINVAPQEGKSTLAAVYTPLRALQLNPNCRIILATYAESLAHDHSRTMREIILRHGSNVVDAMTGVEIEDKLGFQLSSTSNKVDAWRVQGTRGGLIAAGLHGSITGRAADLLIIDDPYKDMQEADSPSQRAKVNDWMRSVARTRLSPQASIILIQTRWHPEDLAGEILEKEKQLDPTYRTWHHVNIPAISEEGLYDSLGRPPGVEMVSARGDRDWEATRRDVGDRVWYALYQGSPRNPAGGLFLRSWFEPHMEVPEIPVAAIVGIDPADTGKDDETGIVGGYLCPNGKVLLAEDWSGKFTSDAWARQAVLLALEMGAREIAMEAYSAAETYTTMLKRAWTDIHNEAVLKRRTGASLTKVERRACAENMPFTIYKWRGRANSDAVARSGLMRQAFETGKARTVPHKLAVFEDEAADWQVGQHQPDRVAAALIVHDRLAKLGGGTVSVAAPIEEITERPSGQGLASVTPIWLRRRLGDRAG